MNNINYEQKYLKYKYKYLKIKELSGGTGPIDDYIDNIINNLFGIKQKPENNNDTHDTHDTSHIPHDDHKKHSKIIKKHTEIESETEGFEHGHH
jgi:hypothetical protein